MMNLTPSPADSPKDRPDDLPSAPPAVERDRRLRQLNRLRALADALGAAADWFESSLNVGPKPYHMVVVRCAVFIECDTYPDFETLDAAIFRLRTEQAADPDEKIQIFVFQGERLQLQKGPSWALRRGGEVLPLQTPDTDEFIDETGSLFEAQAVNNIVGR